jgi:hypothetical protein
LLAVFILKRKLYGLVVEQDSALFTKRNITPTQAKVDSDFKDTSEKDEKFAREQFQRKVISSFFKNYKSH